MLKRKLLGRPRRRWEDNIKIDLREVEGGFGDWMELAQDRDRWRELVSMARNLRVPKMRGISWLAAETVSFSRRTLLHGVSKLKRKTEIYSSTQLQTFCSFIEKWVIRIESYEGVGPRSHTKVTHQNVLGGSIWRRTKEMRIKI